MKIRGAPSRDVQDLYRALGVHELLLMMLLHKYDQQFLAVIVRCYRILGLFSEKNPENQMLIVPYISTIVCIFI